MKPMNQKGGLIIFPEKKEILSEKVYRAVRNMIVVHRFEPGFHINVEKLARELGVSRTPAWEAIRRLEQEGVIRNIPNRGVFMVKISLKQMLEVMQVRCALDNLAGTMACERIDDLTLDHLHQCLSDQLQAIERSDLAAYFAEDNRFHRLIYAASGNVCLTELIETITLQMLPVPYSFSFENPSHLTSVYETHQAVFEGLMNRDPILVKKAMTRHAEVVITNLEEQIRIETR